MSHHVRNFALMLMTGASALSYAQELKTEIYGKLHIEMNTVQVGNGPTRQEFRDSASRVGWRGARKIQGDATGFFGIELSYAADAGTLGSTPLRAAYLGAHMPWGSLAAGRLDNGTPVGSPFYNQVSKITSFAPNDSGITAWTDDMLNVRNRQSNALGYRSPKNDLIDVRARVYLRGTNNTSESTAKSFDIGAETKLGPFDLGVGLGKDTKQGGLVANDFRDKAQAGIRWNNGLVEPYALIGEDRYLPARTAAGVATSRERVRYGVVGLEATLGQHVFATNLIERENQRQLTAKRRISQLSYAFNWTKKDTVQLYVQRDDPDNTKADDQTQAFGVAYLFRF